jgi:hypothetical protein
MSWPYGIRILACGIAVVIAYERPPMTATPADPGTHHHHARRMGGRDPHEVHRVATPLELLFDLTFIVSFGLAASQLAHALAEGHYAAAMIGFGFASFSIC